MISFDLLALFAQGSYNQEDLLAANEQRVKFTCAFFHIYPQGIFLHVRCISVPLYRAQT